MVNARLKRPSHALGSRDYLKNISPLILLLGGSRHPSRRHVMSMMRNLFAETTVLSVLCCASPQALAGDTPWRVAKASGEERVGTAGTELASLDTTDILKPGDAVRTGRNGQVLLVRGEEHIFVSPNSEIGIPLESKDGLLTAIAQRVGSILL